MQWDKFSRISNFPEVFNQGKQLDLYNFTALQQCWNKTPRKTLIRDKKCLVCDAVSAKVYPLAGKSLQTIKYEGEEYFLTTMGTNCIISGKVIL